jgi:ABC-type sugar transport system permease subunit
MLWAFDRVRRYRELHRAPGRCRLSRILQTTTPSAISQHHARWAKATEILVYKVWYDGIVGLALGGSAAQSVVLMAIVIGLTAIQFRFIERPVHYT